MLSILLAPGLGCDRADAGALRLLCRFAGDGGRGPLRRIGRASPAELCAAGGITPAAAARLLAAMELGRRLATEAVAAGPRITSGEDVFGRFHPRMRDLAAVEYWVLVLNGRNEAVRETRVSVGCGPGLSVHPRDVLRPALEESAKRLILVHNDPEAADLPAPARSDRPLTLRLADAAATIGLELWDHVVVGEGGYLSFREAGLFSSPGPPGRRRPTGRAAARARASR